MSLKQRATAAILAGALPDIPASLYESHEGRGHQCALCRYRIQIGSESAAIEHRSRRLELHPACFSAWQTAVEILARKSPDTARRSYEEEDAVTDRDAV